MSPLKLRNSHNANKDGNPIYGCFVKWTKNPRFPSVASGIHSTYCNDGNAGE